LRLAQELRHRGHDVTWIGGDVTSQALRRRGEAVELSVEIEKVMLAHLLRVDSRPEWVASCGVLSQLHAALESSRPECLLVDRVLAMVVPIAESLGIPFAVIGSPGGNWTRSAAGMWATPQLVEADLTQRLTTDIDWFGSEVSSEWAASPGLNVAFLGRSFYAEETVDSSSAFVNLFSPPGTGDPRHEGRLAFAFGQTGVLKVLQSVLDRVVAEGTFPLERIDVLLGGRPGFVEDFRRYRELGVAVHSWQDYRRAFADFSALVTFGGIGTLWHAIDQSVPALVVPGGAGDQMFNANAIERCGLGLQYDSEAPVPLSSLFGEERAGAFERFKDDANFTDDLTSACDRIESL